MAALGTAILERMRRDLFVFYPRILLSGGAPNRTVSAVDDHAIEIREGDLAAEVMFDTATDLPCKILYQMRNKAGLPIMIEEDPLDFHEVQGLKLPFLMRILEGGQEAATVKIAEWKINQGLKPSDLSRRP